MLAQTAVQNQAGARAKAESPFAGTSGNGLADINRRFGADVLGGGPILFNQRRTLNGPW
jgi:hypothetical protein